MRKVDGGIWVWKGSRPTAEVRNFNYLQVLKEWKDERGWLHRYLDMEVKLTGYQIKEKGPRQVTIVPELKIIFPETRTVSDAMKKHLTDEAVSALLCWIKADARDVIKEECRIVEEGGKKVIEIKLQK